jgi:hypothetical protein
MSGETVMKINKKRKVGATLSKVKPSLIEQIQIKLMVVNQYFKISTIYFMFQEGVCKDTLLLFLCLKYLIIRKKYQ